MYSSKTSTGMAVQFQADVSVVPRESSGANAMKKIRV